MSINTAFNQLSNIIKKYHCCSVKHLNRIHDDISVIKMCKPNGMTELYANNQINNGLTDTIYVDNGTNCVVAVIRTNCKFDIFNHSLSISDAYEKIHNYGLAINGHFKIKSRADLMVKNDDSTSYLIIGSNLQIVTDNQLNIINNVTYAIEGFRLINRGKPFESINTMKDAIITDVSGLPNGLISGSEITIDYQKLKFIIRGIEITFDKIDTNIKFVHNEMFSIHRGLLIVALDNNGTTMIIYRPNIDYFNMILLLITFNCFDAILISDSDNVRFLWKTSNGNIEERSNSNIHFQNQQINLIGSETDNFGLSTILISGC